jgi:hypothetical protein
LGEPFESFSEVVKIEGFDYFFDPVVAGCVDESFEFHCHHLYSSVAVRALTAVDATYSVLTVAVVHFKSSVVSVWLVADKSVEFVP